MSTVQTSYNTPYDWSALTPPYDEETEGRLPGDAPHMVLINHNAIHRPQLEQGCGDVLVLISSYTLNNALPPIISDVHVIIILQYKCFVLIVQFD